MIDITELTKLRPCGRLETYSTSRHHLGYYNNVCLAATYTAPSQPRSLEGAIYAALKQVIIKHTILSAVPVDEDQSYPNVYFARIRTIDMRGCVELRQRKNAFPGDGERDEELDKMLGSQHNRNFKDNFGSQPFWRLAVLTSSGDSATFTATWAFHHALADGTSALLFHDTFLAALNALGPDVDANPIVDAPHTDLPPPFEQQNPMAISWSFFIGAIAKSVLPSLFDKRPAKLWTGNSVPAELNTAPRFNTRTEFLTTERLALISREQGVSVTATLQALLSASMFLHLPAQEFDKVLINGPIAMRPFLKDVPADQMTNAITSYEIMHQRPAISDSTVHGSTAVLRYFSWSEAKAVKSAIQAAVAKRGSDNPVSLLKYVSNMHDFVKSGFGKPRKLTAEMSSIGLYKPKSEGKWKIGRMTLSQCANPTSAAFHINVINNALNVNWCDGAVDEDLLVKIIEGVKEGILALTRAEQDCRGCTLS